MTVMESSGPDGAANPALETKTGPSGGGPSSSSVQVAVRVRPMLPQEAGNTECVEVLKSSSNGKSPPSNNVVRLGGDSGPRFTFDEVFPLSTTQHQVYENCVAPLVASCLEGYNATILAYGQTGSGKTHTIMGPSSSITTSVQDERQAGVIPRAIRNIFEQLCAMKELDSNEESEESKPSYDFDVRVQFLEVYGEEIRDLLTTQQSKKKLSIRDVGMDEPEVVGATETKVDSAEEALLCLTRGMYRRVTGATAMNESSSRSHAILSLIVEQSVVLDPEEGVQSSGGKADSMQQLVQGKRSKFNFVDLAGSERQKRTQASGQRLKEGININQGLLVLGNVISALGDPKNKGKTFVPYRDSKLTRLLKGSLGGNHKTLMIACVSPSASNLEESLNCLRYANRAKNIQNHAVVNIDATSRLVGELRGKLQLLAADLLKARDGHLETCAVPIDIVESLAKGGDGESLSNELAFPQQPQHQSLLSPNLKENRSPMKSLIGGTFDNIEVQRIKAENEALRIRIETQSSNDADAVALQNAFIDKVAEYEREISVLKSQALTRMVSSSPPHSSLGTFRTPSRHSSMNSLHRSESPELNKLRAQMFGSMAQPKNLDAEVEAEEKAVKALTNKYLGQQIEEDEDPTENSMSESHTDIPIEAFTVQLEAEVFELSTSISAKEELIQKLQVSQQKYEAMREFYEEKLKEMSVLLGEKEKETEKLSEELKLLDENHSSGKEVAERLKRKQQQLAELKKKKAELARLTSVASKNENQISKLHNEVVDMKQKKVELQKQITSERKSHAAEVQRLKKETIKKDKELNKVKKIKDQKTLEAQRAQQMAKSRLEQVNQLKTKYKETEKRLRMQTVKRGVMTKAGLDPVMVGRRPLTKRPQSTSPSESDGKSVNIDGLRDMFDQKVADVGRREALAEKLAQEWEEHLDLSSRRDELTQTHKEESAEAVEALNSQIKYKEDRIRQLAVRLGKRQRDTEDEVEDDEKFLFGSEFKKAIGNCSPVASLRIAAKVLFGMVVRERRRIAALARTASSLDEKVQQAEEAAAAKDTAFRAYVDEQRLEAAESAQNQQQHILSLMEMVREQPRSEEWEEDISSPVRSAKARHAEKANSKLLLLANERIAVLEQQLQETQLGREAIQKHREREEEAKQMLEEKTLDAEDLEEELTDLRNAIRLIRDEVSTADSPWDEQERESILQIAQAALHPASPHSESSKATRRRRSSMPGIVDSPKRAIRRQVGLENTSDSDEVPDWAEDIMKDLAIIAEGKMPSSLMESGDVMEVETQLEGQSVFDRLTNPNSFTGVQKQKKMTSISNKKPRDTDQATDGQRQRKMISKQVADSLDRIILPETAAGAELGARKRERAATKEDDKKRSVFDRLLSPSNLTGTQKQRFQDKKGKRDTSESSNLDMALEEATEIDEQENSDDWNSSSGNVGLGGGEPKKTQTGKSQQANKREEYKGLNVFERLNKTTTQAYAVKKHVNLAEKMLDDLLDEPESNDLEDQIKPEPHFERLEAYAQQNVFERLQKTTTHAYAGKQTTSHSSDGSQKESSNADGDSSGNLQTGSFSHMASDMLDALLDDPDYDEEYDSEQPTPSSSFTPISKRLRPRG